MFLGEEEEETRGRGNRRNARNRHRTDDGGSSRHNITLNAVQTSKLLIDFQRSYDTDLKNMTVQPTIPSNIN